MSRVLFYFFVLPNKYKHIDSKLNSNLSLISYIPDYDVKVQLTSRVTYKAPKDGILVLIGYINGGWAQCEVGGILFCSCTPGAAASSNSVEVPVPKGTEFIPAFDSDNAYFVPYK